MTISEVSSVKLKKTSLLVSLLVVSCCFMLHFKIIIFLYFIQTGVKQTFSGCVYNGTLPGGLKGSKWASLNNSGHFGGGTLGSYLAFTPPIFR